MSHLPVMLDEVVRALDPHDGGLYIDGTFGAGGYSRAILSAADCRLIGIDRDPSVIPAAEQLGKASGGRFVFVQAPFSKMAEVIRANGGETVDGIVLDIGVSSMQIDQAERGFSFMRAGPLDMRMARSGASAADAVNLLAEEELADIFYVYGAARASSPSRLSRLAPRRRSRPRIGLPPSSRGQPAENIQKSIPPPRSSRRCGFM